jgi:histone deacetylase 1/2
MFSPMIKPATIRTVLSISASPRWPIHQLDVKNAFLHGTLSETVYSQQPSSFVHPAFPSDVCKLNKSLYGLKQALWCWFQRFTSFLRTLGFLGSKSDSSLFILCLGSETAYLLLYVDDVILTANSQLLLQQIIASICHEFAMSDLGPLQQFFGIHVTRIANGLFLSQHQYCNDPKIVTIIHKHLEHIVQLKIPIIKKFLHVTCELVEHHVHFNSN